MRLFLAMCLLLAPLAAQPAERPNIILMMADDLGWGDVGFNGNTVIRTPHLDAMAEAGLRFTRFYAAAPVCSPTRGAALTGRHPYRYGIWFANEGHLKPEELTLAELLRERGYATGHFGKWHVGTLSKTVKDANRGGPGGAGHFAPPWLNGFDECFSTESKVPTYDPMLKPKAGAPQIGWDYIPDDSLAEPYGTYYWNSGGEIVRENLRGDDSRVIMDRAVPFIERAAKAKQPFFAVIWFHTPHLPVVAGPEHIRHYAQYPSYERNYYGCITAMDEQVGRLRAKLRELGVASNTMLWFSSDNGPEGQAGQAPGSAGPFRGRKRDLYEGGVRVPGLLEWPARVKPGTATDVAAVTSDYLPTILDLLGVAPPDSRPIDGTSLMPLIAGRMTQRGRPIGFESNGRLALTADRYKLIRHGEEAGWELFDLIADPAEARNIAAEQPDVVARMKKLIEEWRASCKNSNAGHDY